MKRAKYEKGEPSDRLCDATESLLKAGWDKNTIRALVEDIFLDWKGGRDGP